MNDTLIIGLGSELRGDDAVGLFAAREIDRLAIPGVKVIEHHGDGLALIASWENSNRVTIIDAVKSSSEAGTIHQVDALATHLRPDLQATTSHAFGLAEVLELARQLNRLPQSLRILGIEGKSYAFGSEMSPEAAGAARLVIELIAEENS